MRGSDGANRGTFYIKLARFLLTRHQGGEDFKKLQIVAKIGWFSLSETLFTTLSHSSCGKPSLYGAGGTSITPNT